VRLSSRGWLSALDLARDADLRLVVVADQSAGLDVGLDLQPGDADLRLVVVVATLSYCM
jgi:hypothetical protein